MPIRRITYFKIADEKDVETALTEYEKMAKNASKDGKPYMLSCSASKLYNDPRSQGYTVAAMTRFSSLDDMKFYDEQCEAHQALKGVMKGKVGGPPMVMYMDE